MKMGTGPLRINPYTGRYTRARELVPPGRNSLSWRQVRILETLRQCGALTQEQLHRKLGLAPALRQQLDALWKRQLIVCDGGRWRIAAPQPITAKD